MGFFDWSAPMIHRFGQRWTAEDAARIAAWLGPSLGGRGRLLDVGGASGGLAARLADATGCTVTVLDPTPALLARLPVRPDLTGITGGAERMPLPSASFDAVVCTDAFHHFRAQEAAAAEMVRVTRAGGAVLVLDLDVEAVGRTLVWAERLVGEPAAFLTPEDLAALFALHGAPGDWEMTRAPSFRFLGTVADRPLSGRSDERQLPQR